MRAVRFASASLHEGSGPAEGPDLLRGKPGLAPLIARRWLTGEPLDPALVARDAGVGAGIALALAAAVETLDPQGPDVEAVRIRAWLLARRASAPPARDPADAALDLLASRGAAPAGDLAWFARRPDRHHRIRPATTAEIGGPDLAGWVTLAARRPDGAVARLCVVESDLPRSDRGEADLRRLFRELAVEAVHGRAASDPVNHAPDHALNRGANRGIKP